MRTLRSLAVVVSGALLVGSVLISAPAAWAAAGVSVTGPDGTAVVAADTATSVTVSGSGFQAIQNGFGGVYVLFGWVDDPDGGSWMPSRGGVVGTNFRYVPDVESADNAGFQKFIAFSGSQTESSAQGVIAADGSWSIGMVIPGAVFESQDRAGAISEVDCRSVTCGIITIGAHGVKNANNETFTPVTFAAAATGATGGEAPANAPAAGVAAGSVRLGVESQSVQAGTSVVFTGQGFIPGEQVVASLDGGLTAVGPLSAGLQGEVAAALPVPLDIRNGTHVVTLRGAGSDAVAEAEITVSGGTPLVEADPVDQTPSWVLVLMLGCIVTGAVLVIASVVAATVRSARRRRARRAARATAAAMPPNAAPIARPAAQTEDVRTAPVPVSGPDDMTAALPVVEPEPEHSGARA